MATAGKATRTPLEHPASHSVDGATGFNDSASVSSPPKRSQVVQVHKTAKQPPWRMNLTASPPNGHGSLENKPGQRDCIDAKYNRQ